MAKLPSLLVTTNYPPHIGGMEEYYAQLARHLDERPVFVSTTRAPAPGDGGPGAAGVNVVRLPFRRSSANRFVWVVAWWLAIVPLVLRHGIRFLHCGNLTPTGYLGLWTKRLLGVPYSLTFHGMDVERAIRKRAYGGMKARTAARIVAEADVVFANSRDTQGRLAR
ncbi:glycosyltransferase, partial [bacterium]|nr:glycosyltransferase [bacterium]